MCCPLSKIVSLFRTRKCNFDWLFLTLPKVWHDLLNQYSVSDLSYNWFPSFDRCWKPCEGRMSTVLSITMKQYLVGLKKNHLVQDYGAKNHALFETKMAETYTLIRIKTAQLIRSGAPHTYITLVREHPLRLSLSPVLDIPCFLRYAKAH